MQYSEKYNNYKLFNLAYDQAFKYNYKRQTKQISLLWLQLIFKYVLVKLFSPTTKKELPKIKFKKNDRSINISAFFFFFYI